MNKYKSVKKFLESMGFTCKNWSWSWSYIGKVDEQGKTTIVFGMWNEIEKDIPNSNCLILDKNWKYKANKIHKSAGYSQAIEHIEKLRNEPDCFKLKIFIKTRYVDKNGKVKIKSFTPNLIDATLKMPVTDNNYYVIMNAEN